MQRGRVAAVQFHPEKSGEVGLAMLRNFLSEALTAGSVPSRQPAPAEPSATTTRFCKRVIAWPADLLTLTLTLTLTRTLTLTLTLTLAPHPN